MPADAPSGAETPRAVLVTGAGGLVGSRVVARLAAEAGVSRVVAVDVREPRADERIPRVHYETCDVRDAGLARLVQRHGVDTVVHLAALVSPGRRSSRELEYAVDVLGSRNVLDACLAGEVRQLVYLSSGAAYGYHADNPVPLTEEDPLRGNRSFAYAWHKRLVEEMLAEARGAHPALRQLIFRPGTILGERVSSPITALFERRWIIGVAGSDAPFVLVWDEDVAACIVKGIRERREGIFNLAGDGVLPLPEIAHRLGRPYVPVPPALLAAGLGAARALRLSARGSEQVDFLRYRPVLSNGKLKREFGFTPGLTSEGCFERYRALRFGGGPTAPRERCAAGR